jgi:uncharacterized membrane protein HdeD (DUF308 family)
VRKTSDIITRRGEEMEYSSLICGVLFVVCGAFFVVRRNQYSVKGSFLYMLGGMFIVAGIYLIMSGSIDYREIGSAAAYLRAKL